MSRQQIVGQRAELRCEIEKSGKWLIVVARQDGTCDCTIQRSSISPHRRLLRDFNELRLNWLLTIPLQFAPVAMDFNVMQCNHYIDCSGRGRKKTSSLWRWFLSWMKIEICLFCFTSRHATAQLKVVLMFTIAIWQRKRIAEMIAHQSERQSLLERKKVFVRKSILKSNLVGVGRIGIMMSSIKYYQMTLVGGFRLLGLNRGVNSSWEIKQNWWG